MKSIFSGVLEASFIYDQKQHIDLDLGNAIVDASLNLLEIVTNVLKPCPTLGRQHYMFNMKTIITVLQNLNRLTDAQRNEILTVISLWKYEMMSTIGAQITRYSDLYWFKSSLNNVLNEVRNRKKQFKSNLKF